LRVAVLGAGGFIGSHLVPALAARGGYVVRAIDLDLSKLDEALPPAPDALQQSRLFRHQASITEPGLVEETVAWADVVVSLTALCNPSLYNTEPLAVIDANYTDLVPVVKACAAKSRRLIHFSTCEVYGRKALDGEGEPMARMEEDTTSLFLGPIARERWSYAAAKQLLERVIWAHGAHRGLNFTIIRPFNVIGPRMDFIPGLDGEGVPRVLACFMKALLAGEPLQLVDGGTQRRSFVSVDDFVAGVLRVIERPEACRGQIINLGAAGNEMSVAELAEAVIGAYRAFRPEAFYGPGYDDSIRRIPALEKAERLLEWRAETTLAAMLPPILEAYFARYERLAAEAARAGASRPEAWERAAS
jgi:UDP-apiose/xylose synthase